MMNRTTSYDGRFLSVSLTILRFISKPGCQFHVDDPCYSVRLGAVLAALNWESSVISKSVPYDQN